MKRATRLLFLVAALSLVVALPATAQEDTSGFSPGSLTITTSYPGVVVEPGDQVSFELAVSSPGAASVDLSADEAPEGWTTTFRGGGFAVDQVMAGPGINPAVTFDVNVPVDAEEGTHQITVTAASGAETVRLPLTIRVSQKAGGEVTLTPDFPGLRAPAGDEVTFNVTLRNGTPADLDFDLDSTAPAGWKVSAEPTGQAQATTFSVKAGTSETINLKTTSPSLVDAGQYPVSLKATSGDTSVEATVIVEVVGSYSLDLSTADQRLNADVSVGSSSDLQLIVTNSGTATLEGAKISSTAPSGWDVSFDTPDLAPIPPGESALVTAPLTPSENAVAGDYILTFRVSHTEANDSIDVRTTVNPSPIWGFVGIALIALTLAGLAWVFRRFGRR